MDANSLKPIADLLRKLGYHVIPPERVQTLTASSSASVFKYLVEAQADEYVHYIKRTVLHQLAWALEDSKAVLWSETDTADERRVYEARVCLIIPKES